MNIIGKYGEKKLKIQHGAPTNLVVSIIGGCGALVIIDSGKWFCQKRFQGMS